MGDRDGWRFRIAARRRLLPIVLIACATLLAGGAGWLQPISDGLADLRFGATPRAPTGDIVLVDIDAKSLSTVGHWPWSRRVHADLIDELVRLGAAEIALDIDFSTRSTPDDDTALAAALKRAGGAVILASFRQKATARVDDGTTIYNQPITVLAENAWPASVNVIGDADGKVRRLLFADRIDGAVVPSIPALLSGKPGTVGDFLIDFGIRSERIDRISVADLLAGGISASRISGKKIIVGAAAAELRDFFSVPSWGLMSGARLQALAAETLLQNRALQKTGSVATAAGLAVIVFLFAFGFRRTRWVSAIAILALISVGLEIGATVLQIFQPVILDTGAWQVALAGFALLTVLSEIDLRQILITISRTQTRNIQTVLDRVVADNFAGVLVIDETGVVRAASQTATAILRRNDLLGAAAENFLPASIATAWPEAIAALKAGTWTEQGPREIQYAPPGAEPLILDYVVTPSRMAGGLAEDGSRLSDNYVACVTFLDITQKRRAEDRLAYMARFETLTGLPNRNQFFERLHGALRAHDTPDESCAVVAIDIDRFRSVNETLGYAVSDLLLVAIGKQLNALVGPNDCAACFGGDSFAILISPPHARERAERLATALMARASEPFDLDGHRLIVGISAGIAVAHWGQTDARLLMKHADTALHRAKATGSHDFTVFESDMLSGLQARQEMEVELWDALEAEDFEVFYQPQVDLRDGSIIGVEALLRWHHPARGYVAPTEFIPVAEAVGLIAPLGEWTLKRATAAVARWPVPVKLAVNVSSVQLIRSNLAKIVDGALRDSGLPPERLELEITESLLMQESRSTASALDAIRASGVGIAIDDFGTGYSSLNYLSKFPIDKIKLDRSFVTDIPFDQKAVAIVRAIATLAQSLDIRVNAEGIEKPEQIELLRLLGCSEGQGYLFGKPMPESEMLALLREQNAERRAG